MSGVFAQSDISSPYSRFGLGVINQSQANTVLQGMGGLSNAVAGSSMLNNMNPASYASMDTLTFLFDAGFYMKTATYSTDKHTENGSNASFDYVSMGFTVTKWWKTGLGVVPFTNKDYTAIISSRDPLSFSQDFKGAGGINEAYWANGFQVTKNLSLGFTGSFLFGTLSDETTVFFPDSTYLTPGRSTISTYINNFKFDLGAIYTFKLKNSSSLVLGLTYSLPMNFNSKRDVFVRSIVSHTTINEVPIDTLLYKHDEAVVIKYPQGFGVGLTYKKERFMLGVDFNWDNWKGFSMNGVNDSLQNSWNIVIGGSYKPVSTSVSKYHTKMTYRFGVHFDQTYLRIYDTPINRFGLTFGLGLPMPKSLSAFNLAFEIGKMGTTRNHLVREMYFNISVGISIHNTWFVKRKYK